MEFGRDETEIGWQEVLFDNPVAITAESIYVASYSDPQGHFSLTMPYFNNNPVISANGLLETIPSPLALPANGVYNTTPGAFPNITYEQSPNYWVDVVYAYSIDSSIVTNNITSIADNGTCTITGNPISSVNIAINAAYAPGVTSPIYYQLGDIAVPLNATGINLLWYYTLVGGIGSPEAPTPSTSAIGTSSYFVSQTIDGCESSRAQIDVIVTMPVVPPPDVISPVYYNQWEPSVPLTAIGINLLWYTSPSGGTGSPDAPIPSTATPGTASYYVSQTINGFESPRAMIDVIVIGEGGWFDQNWLYRIPVVISNPAGTLLTDYQVLITLDDSFDFSKTNPDGSDIRFTDETGLVLIPYWIESWDATAQQAMIWVKMPSIPTSGATAFLYFGNPSATTMSDGIATFKIFDDTWEMPAGNLNPVHVATQPWWESEVSYPIVFEDNSFPGRDRFHMHYDGHFTIGHAKGYATSPDLINWTSWDNGLSGIDRINPTMGVGYAGNAQFAWGDLFKVDSVYHMYPSQGPGIIVHCQSTDQLVWTDQYGSTVSFDALITDDPSGIGTGVALLKEADGITPIIVDDKYWMVYFHGFSGGPMYMAWTDTNDLFTWTTSYSGSPVLTPGGWEGSRLWTPSFTLVNDTYYIYYQGGSPYQIGFASGPASSGGTPIRPDNTTWTKSPNNPVITASHGWDNGFCQDPVLRCFDDIYYLFYTGDPPWTNGFAYSDSPEGPWIQYGEAGGQNIWNKTGNPTIYNGIINFTTGQGLQSLSTYSPGNALGYKANYKGGSSAYKWAGFISGSDYPFTYIGVASTVGTDLILTNYTTGPRSSESLGSITDTFHVYELAWLTGETRAYLDHSSTPIGTINNQVPTGPLPIGIRNYSDATYDLDVDWIYLRNYISPEPSVVIGVVQTAKSLDLTVFLEGPYNGTDMNTHLNDLTFIPLTQPFNIEPWNYEGTESLTDIPNPDVVDWILVELRDATDAASATQATQIARIAALLLKDGSIMSLDGSSPLDLFEYVNNNLFVVLWHRNHLGIMSANFLSETDGIYEYDFTTSEDQAHGSTLAQKELSTGVWGMKGGDGYQDGTINLDDKFLLWDSETGIQDYLDSDYNMDTQSDNKDKNDIWLPNLGSGSQIPE